MVFLVSDTREGGDYIVGRVVRLRSSGEILGKGNLGQEAFQFAHVDNQ